MRVSSALDCRPVGGGRQPVAGQDPPGDARPPGARRACSLRSRSVSLRAATVISQARGFAGTPSVGPLHGRGDQGLLCRVLGGVEMPVPPDDGAEDLRQRARAAGPRSGCSAWSEVQLGAGLGDRPDVRHRPPAPRRRAGAGREVGRRSRSPDRSSSHSTIQ